MRWEFSRVDKAGAAGCLGAFVAGAVVLVLAGSVVLRGCDLDFGAVGSPGKGTDSARLPVTVTPTTDLVDGATVRITSNAFDRNQIVSVTLCLRSADTKRRGVDACDTTSGYRYGTDAKGHLNVTFAVPRVITVGAKAHDCATRAKRCILVAASASDFDESGGRALTFRPGLPAVDLAPTPVRPQTDLLPIAADPAGPVAPETDITAIARGFVPGEPVLLAWCRDDFAKVGPEGACQAENPSDALAAIAFRSLDRVKHHADDHGVVVAKMPARAGIDPIEGLSDLLAGSGTAATTRTGAAPAVDCADRPGRCAIVVAAAADTRRSAILPYTLTPG